MGRIRELIRQLERLRGNDTADRERRRETRKLPAGNLKILVVDDSRTIVAMLTKMLQQNDFEVIQASDGRAALELVGREMPDLIFLDIVMPGMNGFETLRELRRMPGSRNVPVIMISGNAQATEQFYVQRIGADDFMKKPFSRAEVFSRINRLADDDGIPRRPDYQARI